MPRPAVRAARKPGGGSDGAPGEVRLSDLNNASDGTSANSNSNSVNTLGLVVSDPPTQTEMQQVVDKMNEVRSNLPDDSFDGGRGSEH